jgi:hypothetical protein
VAKQVECDRLAQQASDVKDEEVPPLVNDAIAKEMAKLKRQVTAKIALNNMM